MDFSNDTLNHIQCPQCEGSLHYTQENVLFCVKCRICYPVEDGVPILDTNAAIPLLADGKMAPREQVANFSVTQGQKKGEVFRMTRGTCMVIGRKLDDQNKTAVFNIDFTMSLDDQTKKLVSNYLKTGSPKNAPDMDLMELKRLPDMILPDEVASRLHAMLFYDKRGIGVLDLVSRNGTFVNGKEIETALLKSGDKIRVGNTEILLTIK